MRPFQSLPQPESSTAHPGLTWLLRLRWVAILAQTFAISLTAWWLPVSLHLKALAACVGVTAGTNLAALLLRRPLQRHATAWCGALLALDTITLTALLGASGGTQNPFTSFYLLHVTLAALLLPATLTLGIVALITTGYTWLYFGGPAWCGLATAGGGELSPELHAQGMFVALGLTSVCIAFFVGRTQDALRSSETRLTRQERFTGLATLAAGVAHELATPLGTIAVVSRELERTACTQCLNQTCRDDARLIRSETDRCRVIIDRLNADSTSGIGDASEPLPLAHLAAELAPFLAAAHAGRLHFPYPPAGDAIFLAPRNALLQSLAVLVKNACEADLSGRPVILGVELDARTVCLSVRDSGPGITPGSTARLGEPFFTTKPPGQGMGLGLYIARMFAERLRGRLDLLPAPSGGTVARLVLPRSAAPVARP